MNYLERLPDWPGVIGLFNYYLLVAVKYCLALSDLRAIEEVLQHVPIWANAFTGIFGMIFIILKHWPQIRRFYAWLFRRRLNK